MKIFISHKKEDSSTAVSISMTLKANGHDTYLDVVDDLLVKDGDDLGDYIRAKLGTCDSLLAVISDQTKTSWWVPWEIGVATEKDFPLCTYLRDSTSIPSYLEKWPVLRTIEHVAVLSNALKSFSTNRNYVRLSQSEAKAQRSATATFHRNLKTSLGQK